MLTVLKRIEDHKDPNGKKRIMYECICDCGNKCKALGESLKVGDKKSCGCLQKVNLANKKFGRLTVIKRDGTQTYSNGNKSSTWLCRCDCGNYKVVAYPNLVNGGIVSCGCRRAEIFNKQTHGKSKTRLYAMWAGIKSRCYYKNNISYKYYGARGIKMCDEWRNDFMSFYDWAINNGYDETLSKKYQTIDRIDTNLDYTPDNCRFVDMTTQSNNKRNNVRYIYNNEEHTISEWARIFDMKPCTLGARLRRGMSINEALEIPVVSRCKRNATKQKNGDKHD